MAFKYNGDAQLLNVTTCRPDVGHIRGGGGAHGEGHIFERTLFPGESYNRYFTISSEAELSTNIFITSHIHKVVRFASAHTPPLKVPMGQKN